MRPPQRLLAALLALSTLTGCAATTSTSDGGEATVPEPGATATAPLPGPFRTRPATPAATSPTRSTSAARPTPARPTTPGPTAAAPTSGPTPAPSSIVVPGDAVDCARARCVALTFDDGPSEFTPQLLATLRGDHIHATFFVLGAWAVLHPDAVRAEARDGHVVGTHSWNHPSFATLTDAQILDQVHRSAAEITSLTGKPVQLLRPPYGAMPPVMPRTGMAVIMWNTDTHDWQHWKKPDVKATVDAALAQVRPGSILLLHDSHGPSVQAAAQIIPALKARGYTFVTVPQLFGGRLAADQVYAHRR